MSLVVHACVYNTHDYTLLRSIYESMAARMGYWPMQSRAFNSEMTSTLNQSFSAQASIVADIQYSL